MDLKWCERRPESPGAFLVERPAPFFPEGVFSWDLSFLLLLHLQFVMVNVCFVDSFLEKLNDPLFLEILMEAKAQLVFPQYSL